MSPFLVPGLINNYTTLYRIMIRNKLPSREELLEYLEYNKITGIVTYKKVKGGKRIGSEVGSTDSKGYKRASWKGKSYALSRIIWMLVTGEDPGEDIIDHEDKVRNNNKWSNLRRIDSSGNNFHGNDIPNSTGYRCVKLLPSGRFQAVINKDKKRYSLGTYATAEEAHQVYLAKAAELYGSLATAT